MMLAAPVPATRDAFFDGPALEVARHVSQQTGIPVSALLAQMANETGFGTSTLWRECNNPAGMKWYRGALGNRRGEFQCFPDLATAAREYVRFWHNGYYDRVLQVARAGASPEEVLRAIGESPWAGGHYVGVGAYAYPGGALVEIWRRYQLARYDVPGMPTEPPFPPSPPEWVFPEPSLWTDLLLGLSLATLLGLSMFLAIDYKRRRSA